jgi:hypothetical protein
MVLSLLSVAAFSGISDALSGAGQRLSEMPASPSIAATAPQAPAGAMAIDASSGNPHNRNASTPMRAPAATNDDRNLAAKLSEYVYLHQTRYEITSAPTAVELNMCTE